MDEGAGIPCGKCYFWVRMLVQLIPTAVLALSLFQLRMYGTADIVSVITVIVASVAAVGFLGTVIPFAAYKV